MSFTIEKARREGAKIVLGLAGVSGGGKTFTALLIAYGLAKRNASKIGFLDTENRRGRLYADILPNREQFLIADFTPPFSPQRYIDAIHAFEQAGVEVLVIDSATHEWEGTGGCEEIATEGNPRMPRWNKAKAEHKRFMNALLQSSMHVIVCLRAREKVKIDNKAPVEERVTSLGIQPIQEKNFMFELTASLMMREMGRKQDVLKCPEALRAHFGKGDGYIGIEAGEALRAWIDGGSPVNKDTARALATLRNTCEQGTDALAAAWGKLSVELRRELKGELEQLKASAAAYDEHRRTTSSDGTDGAAAADLNAAITQPAAQPAQAPTTAAPTTPAQTKENPRAPQQAASQQPTAQAQPAPATQPTASPANRAPDGQGSGASSNQAQGTSPAATGRPDDDF